MATVSVYKIILDTLYSVSINYGYITNEEIGLDEIMVRNFFKQFKFNSVGRPLMHDQRVVNMGGGFYAKYEIM